MKKLNYLLFSIVILFSFMFYVDASCNNEEIAKLKNEVSKIKVTYKHLGPIEANDGYTYYDYFTLNINNVGDDFYLLYSDDIIEDVKYVPTDGEIKLYCTDGPMTFRVYSNKCDQLIDYIEVNVPKFNIYSLDPLCDGIDPEKFPLCGKYYNYNVDYEDFVQRVKHYRITYNIGSEDRNEENLQNKSILDIFLDYINQYYVYIFISVGIILLFIVIYLFVRKRKKRSILE